MRNAAIPLLLLGLVSLASAANLRRGGHSQTYTAITALATKYDCHAQAGNLEATLLTVSNRNAAAKTRLEAECAKSVSPCERIRPVGPCVVPPRRYTPVYTPVHTCRFSSFF